MTPEECLLTTIRADKARDNLRAKHLDDFDRVIEAYQDLLRKVMAHYHEDEFRALERVLRSPEIQGDNLEADKYRAAAIELIENK